MKKFITLIAATIFYIYGMAQPYALSLLKDINAGSAGSSAIGFVEMNSVWYFGAYAADGRELWRTDGTTAGTYEVKDIYSGTSSGFNASYPCRMNNKIYFPATDATNGTELWSSDGTAAGTQLVKDINPGTDGSFIFQMTVYNNKIYFVANTAAYGDELWSSDGTAAGTQIVKDIMPGTGSANISSATLHVVNDRLVFTANDGTNGFRLWSTDGTAAGTKMISPSVNVYSILNASATMNNNIYFCPGTGTQLWKSDGTQAGTVKVSNLVSPNGVTGANLFVTVGNNVFFRLGAKELWKTDGTDAGTVLVKNMESVSVNGTFTMLNPVAYDNNTLLFCCNYTFYPQTPWGCELWKSDGTAAGTSLVKSFTNFTGSVGISPNSFTKYNGHYYFMAYGGSGYYELWKTNATPAGTAIVRGASQFDGSFPESITVANGLMYYIGWGASSSTNYGLWQSDGTAGGTQKIVETGSGCPEKPGRLIMYPNKGILFAMAYESNTGLYYGDEPFTTPLPAKPACTNMLTPAISITSNITASACAGTSYVFNAAYSNGGTAPKFQWKINGNNISWATGSVCAINNLNNNDVVSCVLTSNADCITTTTAVSNGVTASLYAAPAPVISTNGPITFCQGGNVKLTCSDAASYLWSNGATSKSITVSAAGTYYVSVTAASGCTGISASKTVTVNELPAATITPNNLTTFCQGGSVTLSSSAASSYLWSNGATTQDIIVSNSGNYSVTVTNANGCSASSDATAVTVNPLPTPTVSANGPTTFCEGGSVTLSSSPASYYEWRNDQNQPVWYQKDFATGTAGSYYVKVGDANGCEGSSVSTTVTTNPAPAPTITANGPTSFCQGGSVTLSAPNGFSNYLWSNGATTKNITVNSTGNYSVSVTNANSCSGVSNNIYVFANPLPVPYVTANGSLSFCEGGSVKLSAENGYNSYLWSNGSTAKSITVKTAGTYTVTVTNSSGCTGTSATKTVTVNPLPSPTISAGGPLSFCQGGSVTLTAPNGYSSYLWSNNATAKSITVSTSGKYNVTVTNNNGCSGKSADVTVTVNPVPSPNVTASGPTTFCDGGSVTLSPSDNGTYLWSNGATTKNITVKTSGSYSVSVTSNGCSGTSSAKTVNVNPLPVATISTSGTTTNLCAGATVTLTSSNGNSYLWSNNATTKSIVVNAAGSYTVKVTNNNGCSATSPVTKVTYADCPAPKGAKAKTTSSTQVTLSWNAADCGVSYNLQYKKTGAAGWTTVSTAAISNNISGLLPATTYEWRVATVCQASPQVMSAYTNGANFTMPASSSFTAKTVNGDDNRNIKLDAMVFPNPVKINATLRFSNTPTDASVVLSDLNGKVLWQLAHVKQQQVTIPVAALSNGIYIIHIVDGSETKVLKLVRE